MSASPTKDGYSRLVASYIKIRNPLESYESGLCVWNDAAEKFELLRVLWTKSDTPPNSRQCPTDTLRSGRTSRERVGPLRQPPTEPPVPGHLRGMAGLLEVGGA